jgi:hypothetical protein
MRLTLPFPRMTLRQRINRLLKKKPPAELAAAIGISVPTLYRWKAGKVPARGRMPMILRQLAAVEAGVLDEHQGAAVRSGV